VSRTSRATVSAPELIINDPLSGERRFELREISIGPSDVAFEPSASFFYVDCSFEDVDYRSIDAPPLISAETCQTPGYFIRQPSDG